MMKRLLLFVLLGLNLTATAADKEPTSDSSRLKVRLWFLTTQRIWRDSKSKHPLPLTDNLTLASVQEKLYAAHENQADEGAYKLYGQVEAELGKMETASPKKVSTAIVDILRQGRRKSKERLAKVDSLEGQFNQLTALPPSSSISPPTDPPQSPVPKPAEPQGRSFTQLHPVLAILLAGVLGLLLGLLLSFRGARWLRKSQSSDSIPIGQAKLIQEKNYSSTTSSSTTRHGQREMLRNENQVLNEQNANLKRQVDELTEQNRVLREPAAPNITYVSSPLPPSRQETEALSNATAELSTQPAGPVQPPLPLPIKYYAPATESGFLEDRILQPDALGHLPIELILDPARPEQAWFTLNPRVDQNHIIGDDVDRLKEFFSFLRPEKIRILRAGTAGELRREEGGWRIKEKAGLDLS